MKNTFEIVPSTLNCSVVEGLRASTITLSALHQLNTVLHTPTDTHIQFTYTHTNIYTDVHLPKTVSNVLTKDVTKYTPERETRIIILISIKSNLMRSLKR